MKKLILVLLASFSMISFAKAERKAHLLSVGQGVSFPSTTSTLTFSSSLTRENPVGLMYQEGVRLSILADQGDGFADGLGAELGYGGAGWGVGIGAYDRSDCSTCDSQAYGGVAVEVSNWFALGLRGEEEISTIGMVFNSSGNLRLGLVGELNNPDGDNNNISRFGLGLALVNQDFTVAVDASTRSFEDDAASDDRIFITPGISVHVKMFQLSLNYETAINEDDGQNTDDDFWFGLGFSGSNDWHVAFYSDFYNDTSLAVSFFF